MSAEDGRGNGGARGQGRRTEERQRLMAERVVELDSCTAQDLAQHFDVSIMTVHRDLHELERRGFVRKFHGGVTAQPSGVFEAQMSYRISAMVSQKQALAEAALELVEPGMSVILDDSTTCLRMIPGLVDRTPLHVATTFQVGLRRLTEAAVDTSDLTVIGIGGTWDQPHDSFVGMHAIEQVRSLHADAFFMSTSAVSATDAFHQEERIVALKQAQAQASTRRYLLVDHTKLDRTALHRILPLDGFDLVLTDAGAPAEVLAAWDGAGVRYRVVR